MVDNWKEAKTAHRRLDREWIGTTTFESISLASAGSVRSQLPSTDEAVGPAELQNQDSVSERAGPKPRGSSAANWTKVRRSAGKIVEIKMVDIDHIEDDHGSQEEAEWDLLSVENELDDEELVGEEATSYRAITARLNYIGPDRIDIQYAVKEAARHMSTPMRSHLGALIKIGKYLLGRPRLVSHFKWQAMPTTLTTYTDSDWAGCPKTARSTSGGIICWGSHVIKS